MKNKKKILLIVMIIIGFLLMLNGLLFFINNNHNNKINNKKDEYLDINNYNEHRDLAGLDKDLIIKNFKYTNKNNKCEFYFILINNKDVDIKNDKLTINFYDKNKLLLNTFNFDIEYLGVHSLMEIKSSVDVKNNASVFEYVFNNVKHKITTTN